MRRNPAVKSYFLSTSESSPRFKRLKKQFADPLVEVDHLFFFRAVLLTFTFPNRFLQRQDLCIYATHGQLNDFVLRLLGKSVRIDKIKAAKLLKKLTLKEKVNSWKTASYLLALLPNKHL